MGRQKNCGNIKSLFMIVWSVSLSCPLGRDLLEPRKEYSWERKSTGHCRGSLGVSGLSEPHARSTADPRKTLAYPRVWDRDAVLVSELFPGPLRLNASA